LAVAPAGCLISAAGLENAIECAAGFEPCFNASGAKKVGTPAKSLSCSRLFRHIETGKFGGKNPKSALAQSSLDSPGPAKTRMEKSGLSCDW
jgi:hypothetical protein